MSNKNLFDVYTEDYEGLLSFIILYYAKYSFNLYLLWPFILLGVETLAIKLLPNSKLIAYHGQKKDIKLIILEV